MLVEKPLTKPVQLPEGTRLVMLLSVDFEPGVTARAYDHTPKLPDYNFFYDSHFGGRRGIWRLLEVLAKHNVRGTFFIPAGVLDMFGEAGKAIKAAGYEVAGHGYQHEHFDWLTPEQEEAIFQRMFARFQDFYGDRGVGFRCCFPKLPRTIETAARHGVIYDSTLMDDDQPYVLEGPDGHRMVEIPRWPNADAALMGGPGGGAVMSSGKLTVPADAGTCWKMEFDHCYREGANQVKFFGVCLHDYICGRPSCAKALDGFLAHTRQFPGVWYATHAEIADLYLKAV